MSDFPYGLKPGLSYNVATSTTSAASAKPVSVGVRVLRLVSTTNLHFALGVSPVATNTTASHFMPANVVEYIQCSGSGTEKVAAILTASTGTLNITEMTT